MRKLFCLVLAAALCLGLYLGLGRKSDEYPAVSALEVTESKTLVQDGVSYFPRQDITVLMILGIDQYGPLVSSESDRNPGAADTIQLLIFDEGKQCTRLLYLSRDTLVQLDQTGESLPLATAYSYGSGLQDSCEVMKSTLMQYLKGMTVDHYLALGMDAMPILNDGVGGIRVSVREDYTGIHPEIPEGDHVLQGDEALDYVQTQTDEKDSYRIQRQQEYLLGFYSALQEKSLEDPELILKLYESAAPYLVTDCSAVTLKGLTDRFAGYPLAEVLTPEGTLTLEDGQYHFQADLEKLDKLVLELFYAPKG